MADTKGSDLTPFVPEGGDYLIAVDNIGGVPATGVITPAALDTYLSATTKTLTNKTISVSGGTNTITGLLEADIGDLGPYLANIQSEPLSDLSDVTITGILSGEILKWNGSAWINNTLAEAGIVTPSSTDTLSNKTINTASNTITIVEADISDLGSYLTGITGESIGSLSDVSITGTPADNEVLGYDSVTGDWINQTAAEAGLATSGHTHSGSDIVSGTLAHEQGGLEVDASLFSGLIKIDAGATSAVPVSSFAETLLDDANQAAAQATLGLVPGTNVQAYDAELAALAGTTSSTNQVPYYTGSGTASTFPVTAFTLTLLDDTTQGTAQATLGLTPGTDVQAYDAQLQAMADVTFAADEIMYFTSPTAAAATSLTSWARTLLDDTTASEARTTLGLGSMATYNGIVEDTTPQLGGNLDVQTNSIISTGNDDITLNPGGTGDVVLGNFVFDGDQTVGAGQDNYVLTYDNAAGIISLEAAAGGGNVSNTGTPADGQIAVWTSSTVVEGDSALTFNTTSDKLSTGTSGVVETGTIELGHASDTTLSRSAAGVLAVEGSVLAFRDVSINSQSGTTYTLVLGDAGKLVTMSNASANTLTIPLNSSVAFPTGTIINVTMLGAGTTTVDGATGVTVNGVSGGGAAIDAQYKGVALIKTGTDTWLMQGSHGTVS